MTKTYKLLTRIIIIIMILSIMKVNDWIERNIQSYPLMVIESVLFRVTRLNWQYGFFTSKSNNYQYLKSNIKLVPEEGPPQIEITDANGGLNKLVAPINAIRINTAIQQMVRDSLYLQVGTRSIALFLFNQYPQYRNIDFEINGHNRSVEVRKHKFIMISSTATLYNSRLTY